MSVRIKTYSTCTLEIDDETFDIPFSGEGVDDTAQLIISDDGKRAVIGCLCQDDAAGDPFEEWDEGEFFQFSRELIHDTRRPELDEFIRLIREHDGRLCLVDSYTDTYGVKAPIDPWMLGRAFKKALPAKYERIIAQIEDADGYYIAPDDVTDVYQYAKGAIDTYNAFCTGDVWGVCLWYYEREPESYDVDGAPSEEFTSWELIEAERDECWGYYGCDYAGEELESALKRAREDINKPRPEKPDSRQLTLKGV